LRAKLSLRTEADSASSCVSNSRAFKIELLLDLLASSRADGRKAENMYEKERIKAERWRGEVERLYGLCEEGGIDTGEPRT